MRQTTETKIFQHENNRGRTIVSHIQATTVSVGEGGLGGGRGRGRVQRCHAHIAEARPSTKVASNRAFIEAVAVHGIADIVHRQLGVYVLISTSVTYLSPYLHTAATVLWNFKHAGQATYGQNGPRLEAARYCELPHS